jgi:hypothetical protein
MLVAKGCELHQFHCFPGYFVENLRTGNHTSPIVNSPHQQLDLDTRTFRAPSCTAVLNVSSSYVDQSLSEQISPFVVVQLAAGSVLGRCGQPAFIRVIPGTPVAGNAHMLIYQTADQHHLYGMFLPSLQRFSIAIPADAEPNPLVRGQQPEVALSETTLYISGNGATDSLVAARVPLRPPPAVR